MKTAEEILKSKCGSVDLSSLTIRDEKLIIEAMEEYAKQSRQADVSGSVCKHCGCERDKHTVFGMCLDRVKHFEVN